MKRVAILLILFGTSVWADPFILPEQKTGTYYCEYCPQLSKTPLSVHWPLPRQELFDKTVHSQESRSWQRRVTGRELLSGLPVYTLAEKAVIRLSPMQGGKAGDWQQNLSVITPAGKQRPLAAAGSVGNAADLPLASRAASGSMVLELAPALAHGEFVLKLAPETIAPDSNWQLSVFDRFSSLYLHVETDKAQYRYGDFLSAKVFLHDASRYYPLDKIEAFIKTAGGKTHNIKLKKMEPMVYQGALQLLDREVAQGENCTLYVLVHQQQGEKIVVRSAHTIFSYTVPSARIKSIQSAQDNRWDIVADIETAMASRYALQAVIYGYDGQGKRHPAQLAQSASWLEKGEGRITLHFAEDEMSGLKPPYYLAALKLTDLTQLKPVYYYNQPVPLDELL